MLASTRFPKAGVQGKLSVEWDGGVVVAYGDTKVVFDLRSSNATCPNVFITHAHLDHAKAFGFRCHAKFATEQTFDLAWLERRFAGFYSDLKIIRYGDVIKIGDVGVKAHNAGHILGSCLYEASTPEGNVVYTGDFNFTDTFTSKAADIVPCDILVIDSTFGSPSFTFPPREQTYADIVNWAARSMKGGRTPAVQTDSIGNAQELISLFNTAVQLPVVVDPRIARVNKVYEKHGTVLKYIDAKTLEASSLISSHSCIFIAPKRLNLSQYPTLNLAYASGWSTRFCGNRQPFPLSDHADFHHLLRYVGAVNPKLVFTCHGGGFDYTFAQLVERIFSIEAKPLS